MIIAVDIGNSAVKAALVDGRTVVESGRLETSTATGADLTAGLRRLADRADEVPATILAVSVVDRWTQRLERAVDELGGRLTVVAGSHVPIRTALLRPDQTGSDRLLAAWAAATLHDSPVIVVDLGTATTVDAVDADGFFLGGAILPGLDLAADALAERTARLPRVELTLPDDVIGGDTTSALRSGIVIGHLGAIRELATRMRARMAATAAEHLPTRVVVTGGHAAATWASEAWTMPAGPGQTAIADVLDPDLVLRGLGLLAEQMASRSGVGRAS